MKLDILVLAAHPDDAELGCGGTILKHVAMGHKVGVVDLTRGELGTRGTPETRAKEAADSAKILGLAVRENLGLPDGFFVNEREHRLQVVKAIRKFQPEIVLGNARYDRHPDHGRASELIFEACFLSGLAKIDTGQPLWHPKVLYHYIQSQFLTPDFVVDVTDFWDKKMDSIRAYRTQFYDPNNKEPDTYISNPGFLKMVEARGIELGHSIGARYGEGYTVRRTVGVRSLLDLV
ncbi:MAG TPA: bacillithiol biosynthesis deacetylase BshB1 [Cyclobacteriaceae bacterium]|nr:bacillithiol biosynthesis deacetylase BshB1 [Cyclobacteriaceae bacterium]